MQSEATYSSPRAGATGYDQPGTLGNPGGSIQNAMDSTRNRLSSAYSTVQQRSSDALRGAEGFIQERPFQAIIYAASIGAVIGLVAGLLLGGAGSEQSDSSRRRFW
ncbi:MAG: hypothetical protein V4637_03085 [Pseudomonadota bacterium]